MSSLEAATRPLRAKARPTTRAPCACVSCSRTRMRFQLRHEQAALRRRCAWSVPKNALGDVSIGSSRAMLSHAFAPSAVTLMSGLEAAMRLMGAGARSTTRAACACVLRSRTCLRLRAAVARVLCPRTSFRFWVRHAGAALRRPCACGVLQCWGHARQREQRWLACSAFARACASGCDVHWQPSGSGAPAACRRQAQRTDQQRLTCSARACASGCDVSKRL